MTAVPPPVLIGRVSAAFPTPLGVLHASATGRGLCALEFEEGPVGEAPTSHRPGLPGSVPPDPPAAADEPVLAATRRWLERYFARDFAALAPPPLDLSGTPFEREVWARLLEIPVGELARYGELARAMGRPQGARAVGLAVGRNPVAILVPCHRVIGANGTLTGYAGGLERKRWLLGHERGWGPLFESVSV